ncbi:GNAT family N-acetyltransferase [Vibrio campbellii]|uniref:GNAT family N-acetyltransferase n=1 Tax=Vibrio campbellii TaxID=680 RepID=UPI00068197AC|nr:GNAT family N-acetyltransferase [Vibrio campbellii]
MDVKAQLTQRRAEKGLGKACEGVLRTLPEWFGREDALMEYVAEIDALDTYTTWDGNNLVGFFSVNYHNADSAELHVLAVHKDHHRQGIGLLLFQTIEKELKAKSVKLLQVKTLGASANDPNYEKTRHFYTALGFYPLEEIEDFWGEGTPCLFMVKAL